MNYTRSFPALTTSLITILLITSSCQTDKVVNMESLLTDMTNRHCVTQFPDPPYQLKQFSSYDRGSVSSEEDGWFANADYSRFVREEIIEERREFVLFDHESPGAIVRWWMTFAGEGSYDGTLRIYIDNSDTPLIEDNVLKVISGQLLAGEPLSSSVSPESDYYRRGHNLYLPIPYKQRCKITYECDAVKETDGRITPSIYYNINYREYKNDVVIESFSPDKLSQYSSLIEDVNKTLNENPVSGEIAYSETLSIDPGITKVAKIRARRKALSGIKIRLTAENIPQALRSTVLSISFDGINSVWVPVGDFFGTGFNISESETWYSSVSADGTMSCNWIMPFRKNVEVSLINFGEQVVIAEMELFQEHYAWSAGSMYFGSAWHEYNRVRTAGSEHVGGTGEHFDINYIDVDGTGIYIGDAVTVFNTADAWWGEGDEKIFVDGEIFPSSIGTGTEDYYGYAWCRPEAFSHPFIAQPTGAGNFHPGMTVNMRYRNLDAIPFTNKISSNIELWHWAPTVMNYALTSYWYAKPGHTINYQPNPDAVKIAVPEKGSDIMTPVTDNK